MSTWNVLLERAVAEDSLTAFKECFQGNINCLDLQDDGLEDGINMDGCPLVNVNMVGVKWSVSMLYTSMIL